MVHELKREQADDGSQHLTRNQFWVVACNGIEVSLKLAGKRLNGEENRFAFKHLLPPPSDNSMTPAEKAKRRLMHRIFPTGDIPGTENEMWHGSKESGRNNILSHEQKYGNPLTLQVNKQKAKQLIERYDVKNTVIDLSRITLDEVLEKIALAFVLKKIPQPAQNNPTKANSGIVEINFGHNSVLTTKMWFNATNKTWGSNHTFENTTSIVGTRPFARGFEIYHLGKNIPKNGE